MFNNRIKNMEKNMKHYSGKALTKTSVIFSLSALLCIPPAVMQRMQRLRKWRYR